MSTTLYVATKESTSLAEALKVLGKEAVGLFYGSGQCRFGRVAPDGQVVWPPNEKIELSAFYEARVFNPDAELRWWNDPVEGKHRAALVSEQKLTPAGWAEPKEIPVIDTMDPSYLLWGQATGVSPPPPGWTTLTTARIGKLDVPIASDKQIVLKAREYFTEFCDGNLAVGEERLLELEVYGG